MTSSSSSASYGAQNCPHCGFKLRLDDSVNVSRQPITPKSSQLWQSEYNAWQPVRQHQRRHFRNSFRNLTPASTNMYAPLLSLERRTQWDSTDDDPPTVSGSKLRQPQKRTTYHFRNVCHHAQRAAPATGQEYLHTTRPQLPYTRTSPVGRPQLQRCWWTEDFRALPLPPPFDKHDPACNPVPRFERSWSWPSWRIWLKNCWARSRWFKKVINRVLDLRSSDPANHNFDFTDIDTIC